MQFGAQTWNDIPAMTERVVVMPLGSLEQHGHHLPLLTDTLICTEIARRAEAVLGDEVLFLPPLWVGASDHHLAMAGTVSLPSAVYTQVLSAMLESLIAAGFKRIFCLNAHGGNEIPGFTALYETQLRHRAQRDLWLVFGSWMEMAAEQIRAVDGLQQAGVIHACELETSMILHVQPGWVKADDVQGTRISYDSQFYAPDFSRASRVFVARSFEQLSRAGAFGYPELGTPDKGERLFSLAAEQVVFFVREFARWKTIIPE
jgi:creatinine amidohydrolase